MICGKSPSGPGCSAVPATKPMRPSTAHKATGRQRGEGSRPSGNNKSRKLVGRYTRMVHDQEANHAAVSGRLPGAEAPERRNSAYPPARLLIAITKPTPQKIQPMALRGWREAMMAPTTEKVKTVARKKTASTGPWYERCGALDRVIRANASPTTSSTTDSTISDQASQGAARVLIPPLPRP